MDIVTEKLLAAWIADERREPATFSGLSLRNHAEALKSVSLRECVLLGCDLGPKLDRKAAYDRATVVPRLPGLPFAPFRGELYRVADLYRGLVRGSPQAHRGTFDYRAYLWFMDTATKLPNALGTAEQMYARLHDTAQEAALARFIVDQHRPVVGFMGGHDIGRDKAIFRVVAELARRLSRAGYLVVSGGGPGLMEAANLGAFLAPYDDAALPEAFKVLVTAPSYTNVDAWLETAFQVRDTLLKASKGEELAGSTNLGVPTWLYGHEPPNVFATHAAKLFYNSLREDGLVTIAGAGLIFGRGNAGTVQEVFQDATQNYYRPEGAEPTPMILLEEEFWTREAKDGPDKVDRRKPLAPLLMALAGEKEKTDWSKAVLFTDDPDEVVAALDAARKTREATAAPTKAAMWLQSKGGGQSL